MISQLLLDWYAKNARRLPWRDHSDPYAIWISEIMLQQTRVETVIDYFQRWMQTLPDIATLASASEQDVLKQWEGLGYYARARNIHKTAQILRHDYGARLPSEIKQLEKLPGIGKYSAAAISSMAYGQDAAALDGNIRRILTRLFDISSPLGSNGTEAQLRQLAQENLPAGKAGDYNQALMDLGAMICLPRNPKCDQCPLQPVCQAFMRGVQNLRPVRTKKKIVPHYTVCAAIIERDGKVLVARRKAEGLLGGLWEFPGGKQEEGETLAEALQREIKEELGVEIEIGAFFGKYNHAYTHFKITLHAFRCRILHGEPQPLDADTIDWVNHANLSALPMGKIDRLIALRIQQSKA
jgi:A/G-specific adenine glycosylase